MEEHVKRLSFDSGCILVYRLLPQGFKIGYLSPRIQIDPQNILKIEKKIYIYKYIFNLRYYGLARNSLVKFRTLPG